MTSKSDGTDTYTYVWNEDNQLESVELNSSPVVDYVYDSGSRMLQRSEGSTTTNFHWDGWNLIRQEKDDGVDVEVTNYLVPHGEVLAFERDDEWFYLHGDGISSTQLVTDESGAQVGRMVYGAWGETLSSSESVPGVLDVRFVGGLGVRNDAATGLIWMRHRWYDPQLQRFISRDPIGLAGDSNLYKYGNNNPVSRVDPAGLQTEEMEYMEGARPLWGGGPSGLGLGDAVSGFGNYLVEDVGPWLGGWMGLAADAYGAGKQIGQSYFGQKSVGGGSSGGEEVPLLLIKGAKGKLAKYLSKSRNAKKLNDVLKKHLTGGSASSGDCEDVATALLADLNKLGVPAKIIDIRAEAPIMDWVETGERFATRGWHKAVKIDGMMFDRLTGPKGMPIMEYKVKMSNSAVNPSYYPEI